MSVETPYAAVHVFEVPSVSPSGMLPGTYCVWVWTSGDAELMFKPAGATRYQPPVKVTRTEEQQ